MNGAEVIRFLGFGATAGYQYLKFLEDNNRIKPVRLAGVKTARYVRSEIMDIANNREPSEGPQFVANPTTGG